MKNILYKIKQIPWYGYVIGIFYFFLQSFIYFFANLIANKIGSVNWAFSPKIPFIDDKIPLISFFVVIYIFSFLFWIFAPIVASITKKENYINYLVGLFVAYFVGFLIFVFLPTYMDRNAENIIEKANGDGFLNYLLRLIYSMDGGERAYNLFPSYHCLISIYCYLGIRKQKEVSLGYRIYSLLFAILVVFSTVFTKQHYILDCVSGVSISLITYYLIKIINPSEIIRRKLLYKNKGIRLAKVSDINRVMEIINDAKSFIKETGSMQWQTGYPREEDLLKDIKNKSLYTYSIDSKIEGIIAITYGIQKNYIGIKGKWLNEPKDTDMVLHRLAISKERRGQGIAKKLMSFAITLAKEKGIKSIKADTHKLNIAMQKTLLSSLFVLTGETMSYIEEVDRERLVYELDLEKM